VLVVFLQNIGFIHPPTVVGRSEARSQSALNFRAVTLDLGVQAPLGQQLLNVTEGASLRKGIWLF
jgi:hypothetical protein